MRIRERKRLRSNSRTLVVRAEKREQLEYAQAEWLKSAHESFLLPFTYDPAQAKVRLYYDATGMARLRAFLKARLSAVQFLGMLEGVLKALDLCTRKKYPTSIMCFDPDYVYVDEGGHIKLACIPLSGMVERPERTPRSLLSYLADSSHVRFILDEDARHRCALDDFVRRTPVLSVSAMREFLSMESGGAGDFTIEGASPRQAADASAAVQSLVADAVAFDMVGLVTQVPASSEVIAHESVAERVLNGVAGTSPTAPERMLAGQEAPTVGLASMAPPAPIASGAPQDAGTPDPHVSDDTVRDGRAAPRAAAVQAAGSTSCVPGTLVLVRMCDGGAWDLDLSSPRTVGRSSESDVVIVGNPSISHRHARVLRDGGSVRIQDLGSLNGTFVRGERLPRDASAPISMGECFRIADETFCVRERYGQVTGMSPQAGRTNDE